MQQVAKLIPRSLEEIPLTQALHAFLLDSRAKNLSPRTVEWYEEKLSYFVEYFSRMYGEPTIHRLNNESVKLFIQHSQTRERRGFGKGKLSSYTVKGTVVALKVFFKFLHQEGYLKENLAEKITTPRVQKKIIQTLSQEQIQALLQVPDKHCFTGFRNYCMLLMFLDTGIRLSELLHLKTNQIDFSTNTLVVLGKGNKERRVPFGMNLRKMLEKYVIWREKANKQELLFVNEYGERMKARRMARIFKIYGKRAGISGVRVSPHTLRHTFAKMSILNGMDAITLQYILGHTSLEMVRNYVNLTQQEITLQRNRISLIDRMGIQEPVKKKKLW